MKNKNSKFPTARHKFAGAGGQNARIPAALISRKTELLARHVATTLLAAAAALGQRPSVLRPRRAGREIAGTGTTMQKPGGMRGGDYDALRVREIRGSHEYSSPSSDLREGIFFRGEFSVCLFFFFSWDFVDSVIFFSSRYNISEII